ncbi:hypothetical protein [Streptomyces sp. YGL11-2]|uniref:hypothetical protein n=1 Tax=Streptomyces sp. YGL11-2 TaxID=3414028 RepID=UPI003CF1901B
MTRALHMRREGVDLYFLSNRFLDAWPGTFYPPHEDEGSWPECAKPLVFQLDGIRFIRVYFAHETAIVHAHEPLHHYLVPAAFAGDPLKKVVTTVATNHPVDTVLPLRQVRASLEHLGVVQDLAQYAELPARIGPDVDSATPDSLSFLSMVYDQADAVDFLCEGQRDFYTTFEGTEFAPHYRRLAVSGFAARSAHKHVVGAALSPTAGWRWPPDAAVSSPAA